MLFAVRFCNNYVGATINQNIRTISWKRGFCIKFNIKILTGFSLVTKISYCSIFPNHLCLNNSPNKLFKFGLIVRKLDETVQEAIRDFTDVNRAFLYLRKRFIFKVQEVPFWWKTYIFPNVSKILDPHENNSFPFGIYWVDVNNSAVFYGYVHI